MGPILVKRLALIFVLFVLLPLAHADIGLGTACTAVGTTSCTLAATPHFGELIVTCAYRGSSATAPGTATGYVVIKNSSGNVNDIKCMAKYAQGNETTGGTSSNATAIFTQVYTGAWITTGGFAGANTSGTTAATATPQTISYPAFTRDSAYTGFGKSWAVCAAGTTTATNADAAPTGMTLRSGTGTTSYAFSDTNGNVAPWGAQTVSVDTGKYASACFELVGAPALSSPVPYLVNSTFFGNTGDLEGCSGACLMVLPIPSTLSGNFLHVWFAWQYSSTAPTVGNIYCNSDTGHATWTFNEAKHIVDSSDHVDVFDYYIAGAAAGCTVVNIDADTALWTESAALVQQLYNVANAAPDSTAGQTSTAPSMTAGAITPTQTGDIILDGCTTATMATGTTCSAATGSCIYDSAGVSTLHPENHFGTLASAVVDPASAAITINHLMGGTTGNSVCTSMALKASPGTGTAPSGVYILSASNVNVSAATTNKVQAPILTTGDTFVLRSNGTMTGSAKQWSGLSDTTGNTYTSQYQPTDSQGGYPNWALDCNATAGNNLITLTGTSGSVRADYWLFEIAGLDHSSHTACYDSGASAFASQATVTSPTDMPSITPTTSGGIILASSEMGTGAFPMSVTSPTGAQFMVGTYTGQSDTSGMGLGNMQGWVLNSSTTAKVWAWVNDSTSTQFNASAIALKIAAAPATCTPNLALLGVGAC